MKKPCNKKHAYDMMKLVQLQSNLRKKHFFWIGVIVALSIIAARTNFHLTTLNFILAFLLSIALGYWLLKVRNLILSARFLKPQIKNQPKSNLKKNPLPQGLKIVRQCLHRVCFSNAFVFFAAILFAATYSGDFFFNFWGNLIELMIFSIAPYIFSFILVFILLSIWLGFPIVRVTNQPHYVYENRSPPDLDEMYSIYDQTWENWMHDPANPASAEHQTSNWNRKHWDEF